MSVLGMIEIFGSKLFDGADFWEMIFRFGINALFTIIIVRFIYYRNQRDKEFLFSILILNLAVFFICTMLSETKIKTGFAFGLFAIFSILRYRTEVIPIKAMTFLFIAITIAVINSMASNKTSFMEVLFSNLIITVVAYALDNFWLSHNEMSQKILYEKIELILPERREELIEDLRQRTGKDITRVDVKDINFLRDAANLVIYYNEEKADTVPLLKKEIFKIDNKA